MLIFYLLFSISFPFLLFPFYLCFVLISLGGSFFRTKNWSGCPWVAGLRFSFDETMMNDDTIEFYFVSTDICDTCA